MKYFKGDTVTCPVATKFIGVRGYTRFATSLYEVDTACPRENVGHACSNLSLNKYSG